MKLSKKIHLGGIFFVDGFRGFDFLCVNPDSFLCTVSEVLWEIIIQHGNISSSTENSINSCMSFILVYIDASSNPSM